MDPTEEQRAIFDFLRQPKRSLIVEAGAGCGKTSTALESLKYVPERSVLFCAFNKRIAEELTSRMPKAPRGTFYKAATFHSLGLGILRGDPSIPKFKIDAQATENLINEAVDQLEIKIAFKLRRVAVRLLRLVKEIYVDRSIKPTNVSNTGYAFEVYGKITGLEEIATISKVVVKGYELGLDVRQRSEIDFCDMIWLPIVLGVKPASRYQAVFVDEAQDLSMPQLKLVTGLIAPGGRIVAVGDRNQEVYGWRGAVGAQVWHELETEFQAEKLPLTITFRCAPAIVELANELVPTLRASATDAQGVIDTIPLDDLIDHISEDDYVDKVALREVALRSTMILSRTNADLLQIAMLLWHADIGFQLLGGKEIAEPLFDIIDTLSTATEKQFKLSLQTWYHRESQRAEKAHAAALAERIEQQFAMLMMLCKYAQPSQFKRLLEDILACEGASIMLSTVHKAKGLEADRVYLLKQTFARHKPREEWMTKAIDQEELNLEYVAITRAKRMLVWVSLPNGVDLASLLLKAPAVAMTLDGSIAIAGRDGTVAIVNPGDVGHVREAMVDVLADDHGLDTADEP